MNRITRRNSSLFLSFSVLLLISNFLPGCRSHELYRDRRVMMGTFVEVVSPEKRAPAIVFDEIKKIENLLSKYKKGSDIFELNQRGQWRVSLQTLYLLDKARFFWEKSAGAFDITIGPLMDVWGFTDKNYRVPGKEEIEKVLSCVGFEKIIFNLHDTVVKFKLSGMKLDAGAIAKGYAVDCAVQALKDAGIKNCLINAGGQIYCLGDKFGEPWHVAVRDPRHQSFVAEMALKNKAVSTSGDYEQYFTNNNLRYAHIMDPKTGYPADSKVISVTVIADDGLTADALSTAIFVLGRQKGEALAKEFPGVTIKVIEAQDGFQ
ncbi:MAG: FAD:protein FMN transferase [Candidatus Omnitrophota bacterium]|jgi:thiamine biosynthesis lipoprotein